MELRFRAWLRPTKIGHVINQRRLIWKCTLPRNYFTQTKNVQLYWVPSVGLLNNSADNSDWIALTYKSYRFLPGYFRACLQNPFFPRMRRFISITMFASISYNCNCITVIDIKIEQCVILINYFINFTAIIHACPCLSIFQKNNNKFFYNAVQEPLKQTIIFWRLQLRYKNLIHTFKQRKCC